MDEAELRFCRALAELERSIRELLSLPQESISTLDGPLAPEDDYENPDEEDSGDEMSTVLPDEDDERHVERYMAHLHTGRFADWQVSMRREARTHRLEAHERFRRERQRANDERFPDDHEKRSRFSASSHLLLQLEPGLERRPENFDDVAAGIMRWFRRQREGRPEEQHEGDPGRVPKDFDDVAANLESWFNRHSVGGAERDPESPQGISNAASSGPSAQHEDKPKRAPESFRDVAAGLEL